MRGCGRRLQLTQRIRKFGTEVVLQRIIIIGGGIAGLSTARYLLHHTEHDKSATITLIDKNYVESSPGASSSIPSSYEEQMLCQQPHLSIPSRRNGNVLCPSLTVPWTTRSLWKETFLPGLKCLISSSESSVPSITFEWSSLLMDRKMVCGLFLIVSISIFCICIPVIMIFTFDFSLEVVVRRTLLTPKVSTRSARA